MGRMSHVIEAFIQAGRLPAALSEAARWGEIELVRELLTQGVPVDVRNESGGTALMNAASGGKIRIIRMLLKQGADVNAVDETKGYTPLVWSVAALHTEAKYVAVVGELLRAGADVNIRAFDGRTVFDFAKERKSQKLLDLLETGTAG